MILARLILLMALLVSYLAGGAVHCILAAEGHSNSKEESTTDFSYRRIYAPEQAISELARGYLPMKRTEFDERIKRLEFSPEKAMVGARVVQARYTAHLVGRYLLMGDARLKILHTTSGPVAMPLEPCRLSIGRPLWEEDQHDHAQISLAPDGRNVLIVSQSATLNFPWSLRGNQDDAGGAEFELQLPSSPTSELLLTLPTDSAPIVDHGIVQPLESVASMESNQSRTWSIEMGGESSITLRVVTTDGKANRQPVVLWRENFAYSISPSAVNLSGEVLLDVFDSPINQLTLDADAPLQLISARLGDKEVAWHQSSTADVNRSKITLDFPEPILGANRVLRLSALIPLTTGRTWTLPRMQGVDVLWQQGETTIVVLQPLSLTNLVTHQCRISEVGSLPSPTKGDSVLVQGFSSNANVQVTVDLASARIGAISGTTIRTGPLGMTADLRAELRSLQGECFETAIDITRPWKVEDVEAVIQHPFELHEDVLLNWNQDSKITGPPEKHRVRVQLSKAIRPNRTVQLRIRATRQLPTFNERLDIDQFRIGRFQQLVDSRDLVSVDVEPPLRFLFFNDSSLNRLDPQLLTSEEQQVIDASARAMMFKADSSADRLVARLRRVTVSYSANVNVSAVIHGANLSESYAIRITPESAPLSRILIHLSQIRTSEVQWSIDGESDRSLTARRLVGEERQQERIGVSDGELWEIVLRRQRDVPFTVVGKRTCPLKTQLPIALAWLPKIAQQSGTLEVGSADGSAVVVDDHQLEAIPAPAIPLDRYSTTHAMFRYDPDEPTLVKVARAMETDRQATAWVWTRVVTAYFSQNSAVHVATYYLENTGAQQMTLRMPKGTRLREVAVNDQPMVPSIRKTSSSTIVIPLPSNARFPVVRVSYGDSQIPPAWKGKMEIPIPQVDMPILDHRCVAWLPTGLKRFESEETQPSASNQPWWSRRLFGALSDRSTNPLDRSIQRVWQVVTGRPIVRPAELAMAERVAQTWRRVSQSLADENGGRPVTWSQVFTRYLDNVRQNPAPSLPIVQIDQRAMSQLGITPRTPLATDSPATSHTGGLLWLKHFGMVLLVQDNVILLTSSDAVARGGRRLRWNEYENVFLPANQHSTEAQPFARWDSIPLQQWAQMRAWPKSPWTVLPLRHSDEWAEGDWTLHQVESTSASSAHLVVYRPRMVQSIGWSALLLATGLTWWIVRGAPRRMIIFVCCAGVVALLVPEYLVPVASGVFLGILLAGVLILIGPMGREYAEHRRNMVAGPHNTVTEATIAMMALILGTAAFSCTTMYGEEGKSSNGRRQDNFVPVIIPIDENRQPTGDLVYLPRPFYEELLKRDSGNSLASQDWMLLSSEYEGTLQWEALGRQLGAGPFRALFEIEVLQGDTRVILPLRRADLHLLHDQTKLDGRSVHLEWQVDGQGLVLQLDEPGRHQLELGFHPTVRTRGTTRGLEFEIPALLESPFRLRFPEDADGIEIPSALGTVEKGAEPGVLVTQLGPAGRLAVHWPTADLETAGSMIRVEPLLWLKAGPGSASIDAKFRFHIPSGRSLDEIELMFDPRLNLRPPPDQPLATTQLSDDGIWKSARLPFSSTVREGSFEVETTFVMAGTSGVGHLRLPRIIAKADSKSPPQLAVTIHPSLSYEIVDQGGAELIHPTEFNKLWSDTPQPEIEPQLAFRLPSEHSTWILATQPKEPETVAQQTTNLIIGRGRAEVYYECDLTTSLGNLYQHRLVVPRRLQIQQIRMIRDKVDHSVRWSRAGSEIVNVLFNSPVTDHHRLLVRAFLPSPRNGPLALPQISCVSATHHSTFVNVYRRPEVQVELQQSDGFVVADTQTNLYREEFGRLVTALSAESVIGDAQPPSARFRITPNRPAIDGVLVTEISRQSGAWTADVTSMLGVNDGCLDFFRLDVPSRFEGPYEYEPDGQLQVQDLPGQDRRRLVFWPDSPVDQNAHLRIRGTLAGQPFEAPDIESPDVRTLDRFLVVPTVAQNQRIQWEVSRAGKSLLPPGYGPVRDLTSEYEAYHLRPGFKAVIQDFRQVTGVPQIRLVDVHVARKSIGQCYGIISFDLQPAGADSCTLRLPPRFQLVHASVAGLPARLKATSDQHWQILLGPNQLPQRILVIFSKEFNEENAAGSQSQILELPQLVDVPVERTLWTIADAKRVGVTPPLQEATSADFFRQDLFRYRTVAMLMDMAEESVKERPIMETENWYHRWARRLALYQEKISHREIQPAATSAAPEIDSIEQQQVELAARLGTARIKQQVVGELSLATDAADVWRATLQDEDITTIIAQGAADSVTISERRSWTGGLAIRAVYVLVLIGGCGLFWFPLTRDLLIEHVVQWPFVLGVMIGLVWWLWLSPQFVGIVIFVASVLGALRSGWGPAAERR